MRKLLACLRQGRPRISDASAGLEEEDAIGYLDFWLNSLAQHTRTKDGGFAPILIVGTHKDIVSDPKDHVFISRHLVDRYLGKPFFASIVWNRAGGQKLMFFPVDNSRSDKDPTIQALRKSIEDAANSLDFTKAVLPLTWLRLLDVLQSLAKGGNKAQQSKDAPIAAELRALHDKDGSGVSRLGLEEVVLLAQECGIAAGDRNQPEFREALSFCHQAGAVLHFNYASVEDVVFLKPQYLIDRISKVVRDFDLHDYVGDVAVRNGDALRLLRSEGILSESLLAELWGDNREEERAVFLHLMLMFHLAVPYTALKRDDQYLVPALLPERALPPSDKEATAHLYLAFCTPGEDPTLTFSRLATEGFLPAGVCLLEVVVVGPD